VRALLVALLCGAIGFSGPTVGSASATQPKQVTQRLQRAIDQLPVAAETRKGYVRSRFEHWVDADDDCQDTRDEVLAAESLVAVSGCDIQRGKWLSYYDGVTTVLSTGFDVDHLVPLAEAWDSGAKRWNGATRRRYANDLRDTRTLVAVTASSNRSKSDRDPAEWMPSLGACKYVRQWVAVKIRWRLTVDRAEKRALRRLGDHCRNSTLTVRRAVIRTASEGTSSGGGSGGAGGLDPRFDYCYQATAAGYGPYHRGTDPEYDWYTDGDSDGVVCE
jgi:hypothetical protein